MAVIALSILSLVLFVVVALQYHERRTLNRDIHYIADKLHEIVSDRSVQKLLHQTDNLNLRRVLEGINRLQEEQQRASAEYARTEISMRRMLSNISHDLRTPLTVISGYVEILTNRTDILPEERTVLLGKVSDKVQEVIGMINTFFDLAKLESGDRELSLSRIHLNEICRKNILSFYHVLEDRGFEVELAIPEEPIYAYANEDALDRILNNLISNAIQYGNDGLMLGLVLRAKGDDVYIEVSDRGKGIQEPNQDFIFERLYTLEDSRNRKFQGSGLGLTITKRLIELMHGTITVTSKPYVNTTFSVRLKRMTFGTEQERVRIL